MEKACTVWEEVLIDQKEESTSTDMPLGTAIHNIEITLGKGGQLARAAGAVAKLIAKEGKSSYFVVESRIIVYEVISFVMFSVRAKFMNFNQEQDEEDLTCPLCKTGIERVNHLFLSCNFTQVLWRHSSWPLDIAVFADKPIKDWIATILSPHETDAIPQDQASDFLLFAALAFDSIWFARKRAVHCGESTQAMTLVNSTHRTFLEHKAAWTGSVSM